MKLIFKQQQYQTDATMAVVKCLKVRVKATEKKSLAGK